MFEILVVSRPAIRADGRAGFVAMALHLVVFGLAAQVRPGADARVTALHEPVRFYLPSTPRAFAATPARPRSAIAAAPRSAPWGLRPPEIPALPWSPAAPAPDLARLIAGEREASSGLPSLLEPSPDPLGIPGVEDVDRGPELATPLQPEYPAALRAAGLPGEVVIEYVVGEGGRVDTSSFRALRFTHPDFVPPIRAAMASARFIPAQRNGRPIAVRVRQRVAFQVR